MNHKIDRDTYIIPPNFIESGTFFGGMFKARNVIEAGILAFAIGVPVFSLLPLSLTARIIALCLTALPAALVALIGISGESLSSFLLIFIKYLRNRRIIGGNSAEDAVPAAEHGGKHIKKKVHKPDKAPRRSRRSGREDFPAEFDEVRSYEIRQKLRPVKKQKPAKEKKAAKQKKKVSKERKVKRPIRTQEPKPACLNPVADYLPISKIENGIIYTKDHRYVKVVEVVPINFMLRSAQEQRNIIYSFVSYLKISPIKLQIKVLTRRAEINRHLDNRKLFRDSQGSQFHAALWVTQTEPQFLIRQFQLQHFLIGLSGYLMAQKFERVKARHLVQFCHCRNCFVHHRHRITFFVHVGNSFLT